MASQGGEELICPRSPVFKPLKFPEGIRLELAVYDSLPNANASFEAKQNPIPKQQIPRKKVAKSSIISFLNARALKGRV